MAALRRSFSALRKLESLEVDSKADDLTVRRLFVARAEVANRFGRLKNVRFLTFPSQLGKSSSRPHWLRRLLRRASAKTRRLRSDAYRKWLKTRYRTRISIDPSATILGYITMHSGAKLDIGAKSIIEDSLEVWGSINVEIGAYTRLIMGVRFFGHGNVVVGDRVVLNATKINCMNSVSIGDDSLIGAGLVTDTDFHNLSPITRRSTPAPEVTEPVVIGKNVWVGYGCLVLKGVTIGNDSVVGAGSVVRSDVAPGVVVSGNPTTVVKVFHSSELTEP